MVLTKEQKMILNTLIDKYERSASFRGESKKTQHFNIKPEEIYPKYIDEREYDFFVRLNQDIRDISSEGYVTISEINMRVIRITLVIERLENLYSVLDREPKKDKLSMIGGILEKHKDNLCALNTDSDIATALRRYIDAQSRRISEGKFPEYYEETEKDPIADYNDFWKALKFLLSIEDELYIRDISVRLFNDSKRLEKLKGRISGCLYKYGDYPEKDSVFEECGVIQTPSYVMVRGPIEIIFGEQLLDIGKLTGDIAFSTETLKDITGIKVNGKRVITIENLTSFHSISLSPEEVAIFLGGYHNRTKREFLKALYLNNKSLDFCHFGDIDAGGFYIYEHLRKKTSIPFKTLKMGKKMLIQYSEFTKKLSSNDIARIKKLIEKYKCAEIYNPESSRIIETLEYMIENNVKLEQEAIQ